MKKLRDILKTLVVHSVIISLLQTCFVFSAQAQSVSGAAATAMGVVNTVGNILATNRSFQLELQRQQNSAAMLTKLGPNCIKPGTTNTPCFSVAGKFFPECSLPPTVAAMPQNACSEKATDPNQAANLVTQMRGMEEVAKAWVNHYDLQLNEASNSAVPTGLKCLNDKKKALDSELIEMINNITRMQDQINQYKEKFRTDSQNMLTELATTNEELMGASAGGKNNLALKTKSFGNYFSKECKNIIGEDALAQGPQVGLNGIKNILEPMSNRADNFNDNRELLKSEINTDIGKIQKVIKEGGLEDYLNGGIAESSKFKSLIVAVNKQKKEFAIAKKRIAEGLAEVGYPIEKMDANFGVDLDNFVATSKDYFKKKYVTDCMSGADTLVTGMSLDTILSLFRQNVTNNGTDIAKRYASAVEDIMKSKDTPEAKLSKVQALQSEYNSVTITYNRTATGQKVTQTPYDFFVSAKQACESAYTKNTNSSPTGVAYKKKVDRGQALLRELQNLHNNYAAELGTRVSEQFLSCSGEGKKSGAACGDSESFDHTAASFCISHASQCANEVGGCMNEAANHVKKRTDRMNEIATVFNTEAKKAQAKAYAVYEAQKAAVMNLVKVVQDRFPGTNFLIPENMFIPELDMKDDTYGVKLASDGKLTFLDDMPKKLELLKKMFKDQQAKVDDEIEDYISKQMAAMQTQKGRWSELASQCREMSDGIDADTKKYNAEGMKNQMAQDAKVGAFCRKYADMRENPLGACEDAAKLAGEADAIAARLTNAALKYTGKFKNVCSQYNNESNSAEDICPEDRDKSSKKWEKLEKPQRNKCILFWQTEDRKAAELNQKTQSSGKKVSVNDLCNKNESTVNSDEEFVAAAVKKLSEKDQDKLKDAKSISSVSGKLGSLSPEGSAFFEGLFKLAGEKEICSNLKKINEPLDSDDTSTEAKASLKIAKANKTKAEFSIKNLKEDLQKQQAEVVKLKDPKDQKEQDALKAADAKLENTIKELREKEQQATAAEGEIATNKRVLQKDQLKAALSALNPSTSKDELKEMELMRIGQQADNSCDSQASNVNIGKNFGIQDEINAFDKQFGIAR